MSVKKREKKTTRLESNNFVISALWPVPAHAHSCITVANWESYRRAGVGCVLRAGFCFYVGQSIRFS